MDVINPAENILGRYSGCYNNYIVFHTQHASHREYNKTLLTRTSGGPLKDVCVNQGPCYPKTKKQKLQYT